MNSLVLELDELRSFLIKFTMQFRFARSIFVDRAFRLGVSFLFSAVLSLFLSSIFPIWVLVLGPLVWGVPHLFAGARYLPTIAQAPDKRVRQAAAGIIFLVAALRLTSWGDGFEFWDVMAGLSMTAALFAFYFWKQVSRSALVGSTALLIAIGACSWSSPVLTAGILGFAHNFMAFAFWIRAARDRRERKVALLALVLTIIGSFVLLTSVFDPLVAWGNIVADPKSPWLGPMFLGKQIWPGLESPELLLNVLRTFAFGQSLHYFIWLKAIPEQTLPHGTSMSFRQSWAALIRELGRPVAYLGVVCSLGILASLFVFPLATVRTLYLSVAASHGYLEFAALPFLFSGKIK